MAHVAIVVEQQGYWSGGHYYDKPLQRVHLTKEVPTGTRLYVAGSADTVTPEMTKAGNDLSNALMNASVAKAMNGLGGSMTWDEWLGNPDVPNRDLIISYLEEKIDAVTAFYLAMNRARFIGE